MKRILCLVLYIMVTVAHPVYAQVASVPPLMDFQGRLTRPDGTPVADGTYSIRFSIWTAASGGLEKWNQTISNVQVRKGNFAVQLSGLSVNTFYIASFLEIKVGNDAALTPRQRFVTVAHAFKAESVKDGAITTGSILDGSVTQAKLAADAIGGLAWQLAGNANITSSYFLGTTNNQPLDFRVNNRRAMRYSYAEDAASSFRSINVLGGASVNTIGAGVVGATIAGGGLDGITVGDGPNSVTADFGTVGGGHSNLASGEFATVGGGHDNRASGEGATVAGGSTNLASGRFAAIGGGLENQATGDYAVTPGGLDNYANADYTFAAGRHARAFHSGAFVWADSRDLVFGSTATNQFNVRATGGVRFVTGVNSSTGAATAGVTLVAGDSSWNSISDRNAKTNFQSVDPEDILQRLLRIPITTWSYKARTDIRHIGPMAQDFYAAFGLGTDDKHINSVDADGVAFAAIQGLHRRIEVEDRRISAMERDNAELKQRLDALTAAVERLNRH